MPKNHLLFSVLGFIPRCHFSSPTPFEMEFSSNASLTIFFFFSFSLKEILFKGDVGDLVKEENKESSFGY